MEGEFSGETYGDEGSNKWGRSNLASEIDLWEALCHLPRPCLGGGLPFHSIKFLAAATAGEARGSWVSGRSSLREGQLGMGWPHSAAEGRGTSPAKTPEGHQKYQSIYIARRKVRKAIANIRGEDLVGACEKIVELRRKLRAALIQSLGSCHLLKISALNILYNDNYFSGNEKKAARWNTPRWLAYAVQVTWSGGSAAQGEGQKWSNEGHAGLKMFKCSIWSKIHN